QTVFKGYYAAYCNKEGRSCSPLLAALAKRGFDVAVSHLLLRFGRKGISPPAGGDQKAPPLDFASWAQLDQLMSAASPPKDLLLCA
ncbi:MAG: hypothetical protein HDT21_07420, partial [Ruminococcus sp.]|nr:hypothetical protein [Ruminococcus sp.]